MRCAVHLRNARDHLASCGGTPYPRKKDLLENKPNAPNEARKIIKSAQFKDAIRQHKLNLETQIYLRHKKQKRKRKYDKENNIMEYNKKAEWAQNKKFEKELERKKKRKEKREKTRKKIDFLKKAGMTNIRAGGIKKNKYAKLLLQERSLKRKVKLKEILRKYKNEEGYGLTKEEEARAEKEIARRLKNIIENPNKKFDYDEDVVDNNMPIDILSEYDIEYEFDLLSAEDQKRYLKELEEMQKGYVERSKKDKDFMLFYNKLKEDEEKEEEEEEKKDEELEFKDDLGFNNDIFDFKD